MASSTDEAAAYDYVEQKRLIEEAQTEFRQSLATSYEEREAYKAGIYHGITIALKSRKK